MKDTMKRVIRVMFETYPLLLPAVIICIVLQGIMQTLPNVFMENALKVVEDTWQSGDWNTASGPIAFNALLLITFYLLGLAANFFWTQAMAKICQGTLREFRVRMFSHMQKLPLKYFDSNLHGDIMSYFTNDTDAMRQMISQSLPQLTLTAFVIISTMVIMFVYSIPLALVVIIGSLGMLWATKILGGRAAKNFMRHQKQLAYTEGFVEEMMSGQKTIKVFCHESAAIKDFEVINDELESAAYDAHSYVNALMPILLNLGNLLYIVVALVSAIWIMFELPNYSLSQTALSIAVAVPFLNMAKQFTGQIGQISNQINFVVMGLVGARRIFEVLDEVPESDEGTVELRKSTSDETTNTWEWVVPAQGTTSEHVVPLTGDIILDNVQFGYTEDDLVLHGITLHAQPGQKVALVGSTGAGKTTIANLLNRFYDINGGSLTFDGIDIRTMSKASLRKAVGIVLQDTNLFSGTILDNIRYGRPDATDEECIQAARCTGADSFVQRLEDGYHTILEDNGAALSQGQRQLIAIARAAVANPSVMILDEATSSIDTHTERLVQQGMDALMKGRTTFVIAHRLSTIRNADIIAVLDHGQILEQGTHEELIAREGRYWQLVNGIVELD